MKKATNIASANELNSASSTPKRLGVFNAAGLPKENLRKPLLIFVIGLLGLTVLLLGILFYENQRLKTQLRAAQDRLSAQQGDLAVLDENKKLVEMVGRLMILPAGEQPTIATVTDLEKLKGQSFFEHAQIGDKVLIYAQAKKAILFRPSENKIIELAPLSVSNVPASQVDSAAAKQKVKSSP
jgi:hypothetical protein